MIQRSSSYQIHSTRDVCFFTTLLMCFTYSTWNLFHHHAKWFLKVFGTSRHFYGYNHLSPTENENKTTTTRAIRISASFTCSLDRALRIDPLSLRTIFFFFINFFWCNAQLHRNRILAKGQLNYRSLTAMFGFVYGHLEVYLE